MICCLCGRQFEIGDLFIRITEVRYVRMTSSGREMLAPQEMEDGSREKLSCVHCLVSAGAPLEAVGAAPGRING